MIVHWRINALQQAGSTLSTISIDLKLEQPTSLPPAGTSKLTWLVLGGDPAARSHRAEQFTALWGL